MRQDASSRSVTNIIRATVVDKAAAVSSPDGTPPIVATPETADRNSIGFLLNCPDQTDFLREFPKSTTLSPSSTNLLPVQSVFRPVPGDVSNDIQNGMPNGLPNVSMPGYQYFERREPDNNLDAFLSTLEFSTFERQNWPAQAENMMMWSGQDTRFFDRAVLEQRAYDIKEKLRYTAASMNPPNLPSKDILDAIELLTMHNIATYVNLYFRHWHKHAPMIHEATFNPGTAALPVVLAMMSLGSMVCRHLCNCIV